MRLLLPAMVLLAGSATAQEPLTLEEAVRIAESEAFSVKIARSELDKFAGSERTARGALGPTVALNGSHSQSQFEGLSGPGGGFFRSESTDLGASIVQTIDLSGAGRAALRSAKFSTLAALASYQATLNQVRHDARFAYWNVALAQALVRVQVEAVEAAAKRVEDIRKREAAGISPKFDVIRFEVDLKRTEEALVRARGTEETARQALNNVLARDVDTKFEVEAREDMPPPIPDGASLVQLAVAYRPEVAQADAIADSLDQTVELQKRGLRPSLAVSASYNRSLGASQGAPTGTASGAVQVSWPIFDSGVTRGRVSEAGENARQARIRTEQLALAIGLEAEAAATRYRTAVQAYETAKAGRELAAEALRLAEVSFANQVGTVLDVTSSQADLTAAKGAVENARFSSWQAYSDLLRAIGGKWEE
ncbi:MAG: TolC family protein [Fimbriimonadaceae bacterium]